MGIQITIRSVAYRFTVSDVGLTRKKDNEKQSS